MSKAIDNDNDEGANLMAASPTRDTRPGGVNPGMYYRPLTPPAGSYSLDGDDGDRRWKFGFDLTTVLRLVPLGLSLADIICWSQGGIPHLDPSNGTVLAIIILTLIWNILHLFLRAVCFCTSVSLSCPTLLCQIGDWRYVFNDPESGQRFVEPRKGADTLRGKRTRLFLTAVVDIVFGVVVLSLGANPYDYWWLYAMRGKDHVIPLHIATGVFNLVTGLATLAGWHGTIAFEFGAVFTKLRDAGSHARIRLVPDTDDRRTAGGTVSVAA